MIITLNVTVGKVHWGDTVQKQIELRTENPTPDELPWDAICAGLIQSALAEYAQAKDATTSVLEWRAIESPSNDFDSKFAIWRYVFCASGEHDAENQIRTEFENQYGCQPVVARRICPTGKTWLVGPVETKITGGRTE